MCPCWLQAIHLSAGRWRGGRLLLVHGTPGLLSVQGRLLLQELVLWLLLLLLLLLRLLLRQRGLHHLVRLLLLNDRLLQLLCAQPQLLQRCG